MKTSSNILFGFFALIIILLTIILFTLRKDINVYRINENTYKTSETEYSFKQEYKVKSPLKLKISTSGGNISTFQGNDSTIEVSFIVKKRNQVLDVTLDQLKEIAELEINHNDTTLDIEIKRFKERRISVGFMIKTPVKSSVNLRTSGGNIQVNGITGSHTISTSGGNIELEKITGNTDASTSGGNISIINSAADFNASTSGGNITMEHIDGKLHVSTSGGNINASAIKHGLSAHTSGGNIDVTDTQGPIDVNTSGGSIGLKDISGQVKAFTSGGDITANLIQLKERLDLETSGGSVDATIPKGTGIDLDLSADQINTPLTNFTGLAKKDRIKGQMNGGGILVRLTTSGGSVTLNYK